MLVQNDVKLLAIREVSTIVNSPKRRYNKCLIITKRDCVMRVWDHVKLTERGIQRRHDNCRWDVTQGFYTTNYNGDETEMSSNLSQNRP